MIKKFKNGKLVLKVEKDDFEKDGTVRESFYHDDMFFEDLYINQINGYHYLVDFNKSLVYDLGSYLMQNPLKYILEELGEYGKLIFYPLPKDKCLSLLEDLENGY